MSFGWASASPAGFLKCLYAPLNFKSVWIFGSGLETQDPGDSAAQNPDRQSRDRGTGARLQGDMQARSTWARDLPGPGCIFQPRPSQTSQWNLKALFLMTLDMRFLLHRCVLSRSGVSDPLQPHGL